MRLYTWVRRSPIEVDPTMAAKNMLTTARSVIKFLTEGKGFDRVMKTVRSYFVRPRKCRSMLVLGKRVDSIIYRSITE